MTPFSNKSFLTFNFIQLFLFWIEKGTAQNLKTKDPVITWSTCSYSQMTLYLHQLVAKHSNIARLHSIGKSVEGRDLWVVVISDHPFERPLLRPQIKYVGNVIGNYGPSCYVLLRLITHLLTTFTHEGSLERRIIEMNEIHILPNINPDGFIRSIPGACSGGHGRFNAAGFDLNRDFPDIFNPKKGKSEQPETQAVMTWIQSNSFLLSISIMSGAIVVAYPYDSVPIDSPVTGAHPTPDDDMFKHLAITYVKNMNDTLEGTGSDGQSCSAIQRKFENGIINGAQWSPASGTMLDYNYVQGIFEVMVGVSCCRNENDHFALDRIWETNKQALLHMSTETEYGIRGQVIDADSHVPISNASMIKLNPNFQLDERNLTPMPWRTTTNGEFWRLILPGRYTLEIHHPGYEVSQIPFEVNTNHFTTIIVELHTKRAWNSEIFDGDDNTGSTSLDFNGNSVDSMSLNITHALVNVSESSATIESTYSKYNCAFRNSKLYLPTILILQALSKLLT